MEIINFDLNTQREKLIKHVSIDYDEYRKRLWLNFIIKMVASHEEELNEVEKYQIVKTYKEHTFRILDLTKYNDLDLRDESEVEKYLSINEKNEIKISDEDMCFSIDTKRVLSTKEIKVLIEKLDSTKIEKKRQKKIAKQQKKIEKKQKKSQAKNQDENNEE